MAFAKTAARRRAGRSSFVAALRNYRPKDFDRLLKIDRACFVEGIAYDEEEMRFYLAMPSTTTLVAEESGAILGFIIAHRLDRRRGSRFMGRIITIDVVPEVQHSGLGTLLLTSAEEELKQAGCDHVVLEVAVDNERALRFYKKHGYSVLKVLPNYYMDSVDGLMMGKRL
jgi:[ribosomal protein S18]-alanine N-acetyltransferase